VVMGRFATGSMIRISPIATEVPNQVEGAC
jgi:hypothetical protein